MPVTRSKSGKELPARTEAATTTTEATSTIESLSIATGSRPAASAPQPATAASVPQLQAAASAPQPATAAPVPQLQAAASVPQPATASSTRIVHMNPPASPDVPKPAPPSTQQGAGPSVHQPRTRSQSSKARRASRLAAAKEELARTQVQLAAAKIATIEAEPSDDEDEETIASDGETARRVGDWLDTSQPHQAVVTDTPQWTPMHDQPYIASIQQSMVAPPLRAPSPPPERSLPPPSERPLPPPSMAAPRQAPPSPQPWQPLPPPPGTQAVSPPTAALPTPVNNETVGAGTTVPREYFSNLTSAITQAINAGSSRRHHIELPTFTGAHQQWLSFIAAYREASEQHSDIEKIANLRKALKGKAREAVEDLFICGASPEDIVAALANRFGRPNSIALSEIERLRALPRLTDVPRDICVFANRIANIVATLRILNRAHYMFNPELTKNIIEKFTLTLRYRWFDFAATQNEEEADLVKISRFLTREAELCAPFAQPENINTTEPPRRNLIKTSHRTFAAAETNRRCAVCNSEAHSAVANCNKFMEADSRARWELAKNHNLCYRCLRYRTKTHACTRRTCNANGCGRTHHSLLHFRREEKQPKEEPEPAIVASVQSSHQIRSYLKLVPVQVSGPTGVVNAWALLDDGSTVTLVDEDIAEQVGAEGPTEALHIEAVADTTIEAPRSRRVSLTLRGAGEAQQVYARTVNKLHLSPQTIHDFDIEACSHLEDIKSHLTYTQAEPRILIGQDNWHLLLATTTRRGRNGQPVASLTPLGWVLHGANTRTIGHRVNFLQHEEDASMNEQLRRYFALESLGIEPKQPASNLDQRALKILEATTIQLEEGPYQTGLLWSEDDIKMPNNYENALKRLTATERKIDKDAQLREKYSQQMEALIQEGYAEIAPTEKHEGRTWYLPHFAVVNPMKPGKVRIVHDAAAKTRGVSLNTHLLAGPGLLKPLHGVMMRFRQHEVAVTADIAEMFMRVKIQPEDRDALRYLWRGNRREGTPDEYRMTSLIFGSTCSPTSAIYVKNLNAKKYIDSQPEAVKAIIENHYVDDYLASYRTEEEATQTSQEVLRIHEKGNFHLRGWASNSPQVRQRLSNSAVTPPQSQQITIDDGTKAERVLGLIWMPDTDTIAFNLDMARIPQQVLDSDAPTKREALRIVMSLYDPLGLASPVTTRAKQILQEVWRQGTDWDEALPPNLALQWKKWMTHLTSLREIKVPRCYPHYSDAVNLQLHILVDASEAAYAAALYWRAVTPDGNIHLSLVLAKSRVAPLQCTSIPRLELQAAVMGARMAAVVTEEHERQPDSRTFWSDSRTVLTWIRNGSRTYRPFVAHRIAAIEEHTTVNEWRWVPTKMNTADDATRDVPAEFTSEHRWFTGPEYLLSDEENWPVESTEKPEKTGEEKVNVVGQEKHAKMSLRNSLPDPTRFSKWERLLRTTARVLQFIELCRKVSDRTHYSRTKRNKEENPSWNNVQKKETRKASEPTLPNKIQKINYKIIEADLLRKAEQLIVRAGQQESFPSEIRALQEGKTIENSSRLKKIRIRLVDGTIQLDSRIRAATEVAADTKSPAILDGDNYGTRLYIEYVHRQLSHAGVEMTINECRQHYWILKVRPATRQIVSRCRPCRIRRAAPPQPPTGDHPACRLAHHRRPFTYAGVDYFGPLTVTVGRGTQKRYGALFTCLTTRAVHLEVAGSLTTDSAIMALRRMVARRGCPTEMWSDNGTNLRGADRELRQAIDTATEEEASARGIAWRYIPPGAPFMGGAWERLVRSVKTALEVTLHERHPTEEVLATLLTEAEYVVNSRPLTHVPVDAEDPEAITPNHFLLGGSARVPTPGTFNDRDLAGRATWRTAQRLADHFWARWLKEYLPDLQYRREPHGRGPAVKIDDVVLIADSTLPRNTWPRGIIIATYPGADGIVRTADVHTKGGVLRRPAKKLIVLPTDPSPAPNIGVTPAAIHGGRDVQDDTSR